MSEKGGACLSFLAHLRTHLTEPRTLRCTVRPPTSHLFETLLEDPATKSLNSCSISASTLKVRLASRRISSSSVLSLGDAVHMLPPRVVRTAANRIGLVALPVALLSPRFAKLGVGDYNSSSLHSLRSSGGFQSRRVVKLPKSVPAREASFSFPWAPTSPQSPEKMTMKPIPASSLYVSTPTWWLESRFHFSFAEYYNPEKSEFGVLRVLNDDLVKPKAGFGTHSHRDMEIFTYVVDGSLTHKDSIGTSETLGRGAVQYMSAGTGIRHSEMNNDDELLRFLQIWIMPQRRGLKPNYGSRVFKKEDRHNTLQHVLTDFSRYCGEKDLGEGVIPIHQDCNIFVSEADPGVDQPFMLSKGRQAYLVCIEGKLSISDLVHLNARDAVEIRAGATEDIPLQLKADKDAGAHFLMIEMALA